MLSLMPCYHYLKILNNFEQGPMHFHFALGPDFSLPVMTAPENMERIVCLMSPKEGCHVLYSHHFSPQN